MSDVRNIIISVVGENKPSHGAYIANVLEVAKFTKILKPNGVFLVEFDQTHSANVSLVDCKTDGVDGFLIILDDSSEFTEERVKDLMKPFADKPHLLVFNNKTGSKLPTEVATICESLEIPPPSTISIKLGKDCYASMKRCVKRVLRAK